MNMFSPHSTRSASTSAAHCSNVPLKTILSTAGWSNAKTFATYYNKPIKEVGAFADSVLCSKTNDSLNISSKSRVISDTD